MSSNTENEDIFSTVKELIFKALVSILPISFYWIDQCGILKGCNQKVLTDLEIPRLEDFVGKHITEIVTQQAWLNCQQVMINNKSITVEEVHPKPNGKRINYLSIKSPLHDQNGIVIGLVGISIDITSIRETEQLKEQKQIAEEKVESMNLVATSIAHELRTPLASVKAGIDIIKDYLPDLLKTYQIANEEKLNIPTIYPDQFHNLKKVLNHVEGETELANSVIDTLLINVKQHEINTKDFQVYQISHCISDALDRYPFTEKERALINWNQKDDFTFFGNELLTVHVLFNLIKNALYYIMAAGKGNIQIWTSSEEKFNLLYFRDTGSGIEPTILPYIFDKFFSKTYHGYGVGLAFCKIVMQSYGGDITCQSALGEYTEFILKFPKLKK